MTPEDLRSLADEATPGPWGLSVTSKGGVSVTPPGTGYLDHKADARLIALAPNLARLCAEMGEALEEIAALEDQSELEKAIAQPILAKLSELEAK